MPALAVTPLVVVSVWLLIRAEFQHDVRRAFVLKPLASGLVILVAAFAIGRTGAEVRYAALLLGGLTLSLGGDLALLFKESRSLFLAGLLLFLSAHLFYAAAFIQLSGFHSRDLVITGTVFVPGALAVALLWNGLGALKFPAAAYLLAITFMLSRAAALLFSPAVPPVQAWLAFLGAALFWLSDLVLAVNRFRTKLTYYPANLAIYYAGQLLIALSASFGAG